MFPTTDIVEAKANDVVVASNKSDDYLSGAWDLIGSESLPRVSDTASETLRVLDLTDLKLPERRHEEDDITPPPVSPRTLLDYLLHGIPAARLDSRGWAGSNVRVEEGDALRSLLLPPEPVIHLGSRQILTASEYVTDKQEKGTDAGIEQDDVVVLPLLRRSKRGSVA